MPVAEAPPSQFELLREYNEREMPQTTLDLAESIRRREALFGVPAELAQAPYLTVCSVWPERLYSQSFSHANMGRCVYKIEAGSPEKPAYLYLQNTYQLIQNNPSNNDPPINEPKTILAVAYVKDVINHMTGDHPGNSRGKKGVGVIKGRPTGKNGLMEATGDEIASLVQMQNDWLAFLVERADEWWDGGKREKIGKEHRKALKMLGLDINQHAWFRSKIQTYNSCPRCAEKILVEANFCKHCHTDLVKYFVDMDEVPSAEAWPTVVKALERATKKAEPKKGAPHA